MNFEQARFNMVEQQIRPWEVLDPDVLDLLFEVKREQFVPRRTRALAFADMEIPIGHGEAMMQPKVEARILQELAMRPQETVLRGGNGLGISHGAPGAPGAARDERRDPRRPAGRRARPTCARAGISNVTLLAGRQRARAARRVGLRRDRAHRLDARCCPRRSSTGSSPGGRLFAVVGDAPVMKAVVYSRDARGATQHTEVFETLLKPLVNAQPPARFRF